MVKRTATTFKQNLLLSLPFDQSKKSDNKKFRQTHCKSSANAVSEHRLH